MNSIHRPEERVLLEVRMPPGESLRLVYGDDEVVLAASDQQVRDVEAFENAA